MSETYGNTGYNGNGTAPYVSGVNAQASSQQTYSQPATVNINDVVAVKIGNGVDSGKLKVSFKKTLNIRQYETEVVDATLEIPLAPEDTGARLAVIESVAIGKIEHSIMHELLQMGMITQDEYNDKVNSITAEVNQMCYWTGVSLADVSNKFDVK